VEIAVSLGLLGIVLYGGLAVAIALAVLPRLGPTGYRPQVALAIAVSATLLLNGVVADGFAGPVGTGTLLLSLLALESDEMSQRRGETAAATERALPT
jgi:hypothetical protein